MTSPTPEEIKRVRKALHLTQPEAAALVYYDISAWARWEQGVHLMHPATWELFLLKTGQKQ